MRSSLRFGSAAAAFVYAAAGLKSQGGNSTSRFASLGCPSAAPGDANWIFETWSGPCYSCSPNAVSGAGAQMCVDASGKADYSSIFVDMASMQDKTGCFAWSTPACPMDLLRIASIEFDVDVSMCDDLWAAPFWMTPSPWVGPAYASGEVDFMEFCPTGSIATNFGAAGGSGENEVTWASASGLDEPKHFTATFSDSGDLTTTICSLQGTNCISGGYYNSYIQTVNAVKDNTSSPFHFVSDVWNGQYGDAGWKGCGASNNPNTNCQYAVKNIRVLTKDGSPMFSGGKCMAMNGQTQESSSAVKDASVIV